MPQTVIELGQKVKAKYPGAYDDLPDDELGRRVKTKYPGAYDDFVDDPNEAIRQAQAAKFPTAAEQGLGPPGTATVGPGEMSPLGILGHELMGAMGSATPQERLPGDTRPPRQVTPEETMGGNITDAVLLGTAGVGLAKGGMSLLSRAKAARSAQFGTPEVQAIEKNITGGRAVSGKKAQTIQRIAPRLAEDPKLVKAKDFKFDQELHSQFKVSEANLTAAEDSVKPGRTVSQDKITEGIEQIIEKYKGMGLEGEASKAAHEWNDWAKRGAEIPFEEFLTKKRAFGTEMKSPAQREVYRLLQDTSSQAIPELKAPNAEYSLKRFAIDSAGIDPKTGRRMSSTGQAPETLGRVKGMVKRAAPYAIGMAVGAGGYKAAKVLGLQ